MNNHKLNWNTQLKNIQRQTWNAKRAASIEKLLKALTHDLPLPKKIAEKPFQVYLLVSTPLLIILVKAIVTVETPWQIKENGTVRKYKPVEYLNCDFLQISPLTLTILLCIRNMTVWCWRRAPQSLVYYIINDCRYSRKRAYRLDIS